MARFGEFLFLLLDGVAQIGELAIELFVVQPQQNGGKREGRRDRQQRGPPAREDSAVRGRPGFHTRDAAARTFGRCDHLTHEGFLHAGRGSHGRRGEGEDRHASARFGELFRRSPRRKLRAIRTLGVRRRRGRLARRDRNLPPELDVRCS